MFLAVREIRHAVVRFGLIALSIALLVFLVLFQQSIRDGLLRDFVGAIRNQSAPVLVYDVDGQRVLQGSSIDPELEQLVAGTAGVASVGRLGQTTVVTQTREGMVETSVIGFEEPELGAPREVAAGRLPDGPGEAIAATGQDGLDIGDSVRVLPGGLELLIVGLADDVQLNVGPTLFVEYATYTSVVTSANPDAGSPLPNVLAVAPVEGVDPTELVATINAQSDRLDAQTREQAANRTPGVAQVRSSFSVVFALYALVVPCVIGLFFLILTIQKLGPLSLLRAIGAPRRWLVRSLLTQAGLVLASGLVVGAGAYLILTRFTVGSLRLEVDLRGVLMWSLAFAALGLASALVSARRLLAIEPVSAMSASAGR
jgi:putative ABC transport system permease protein